MDSLDIRNLPEEIDRSLRARAAMNGRSLEAEALDILAAACRKDPIGVEGAMIPAWLREVRELVDSHGGSCQLLASDELIIERRLEAGREAMENPVGDHLMTPAETFLRFRALVEERYGADKPTGVSDELIAERRIEAERESREE